MCGTGLMISMRMTFGPAEHEAFQYASEQLTERFEVWRELGAERPIRAWSPLCSTSSGRPVMGCSAGGALPI
jgi:hypothetical protein